MSRRTEAAGAFGSLVSPASNCRGRSLSQMRNAHHNVAALTTAERRSHRITHRRIVQRQELQRSLAGPIGPRGAAAFRRQKTRAPTKPAAAPTRMRTNPSQKSQPPDHRGRQPVAARRPISEARRFEIEPHEQTHEHERPPGSKRKLNARNRTPKSVDPEAARSACWRTSCTTKPPLWGWSWPRSLVAISRATSLGSRSAGTSMRNDVSRPKRVPKCSWPSLRECRRAAWLDTVSNIPRPRA